MYHCLEVALKLYSFEFQKNDWETESFYNHTWKKIPERKQLKPLEYGLRMVKKGYYAYHADPDNSYPIIERTFSNNEICELTEVNLVHSSAYIAVRKYSPYFEMQKIGYYFNQIQRKDIAREKC